MILSLNKSLFSNCCDKMVNTSSSSMYDFCIFSFIKMDYISFHILWWWSLHAPDILSPPQAEAAAFPLWNAPASPCCRAEWAGDRQRPSHAAGCGCLWDTAGGETPAIPLKYAPSYIPPIVMPCLGCSW